MAYTVSNYSWMMADEVRMSAYIRACERVIKPGSVVVDLGAGCGVIALIACKLGASRVFAIEPNEAIAVGRTLAKANGYADRITFLQMKSFDVTLPLPADVIVSDLRGVLPFVGGHIEAIADARTRLLRPGGTLLPQRDVIYAALVSAPEAYQELTHPWRQDDFGLDLSAQQRFLTESRSMPRISSDQLLTEPMVWCEIDYSKATDLNVSADLRFPVAKAGLAHGVLVWFDAWLDEEVHFDGGPDSDLVVYGRSFFPFTDPIFLHLQDSVRLALSVRRMGDSYVWRWATHVEDQNGVTKAQFRQTTFNTEAPSPRQLREAAARIDPSSV